MFSYFIWICTIYHDQACSMKIVMSQWIPLINTCSMKSNKKRVWSFFLTCVRQKLLTLLEHMGYCVAYVLMCVWAFFCFFLKFLFSMLLCVFLCLMDWYHQLVSPNNYGILKGYFIFLLWCTWHSQSKKNINSLPRMASKQKK